ncbi:SDR family NAD(P)-dependent oxidoreductase [Mucilaginibacter sp. CAU 1740]|uniref:SDR family oxidoreductase n=1 Tax=Mucilaginibacter sp. CAU 1740 TaxID=3140365 RepID=UPI00325B8BFD
MDLKIATLLITGGSDGIGKGLAKRFIEAGSTVIITGRDESKLKQAADEMPGLHTYVNDISDPAQRELLALHIQNNFSSLNILINNAGIQRRISLADDDALWPERQAEIDTLLSAPVHLNHLLIPLILNSDKPGTIVNVTSGGAYIPQVFAPVYSACKAALHSYTITLRHALADTACRVIELIPPAVQTSLAGAGNAHGAPLDEFCDSVFKQLTQGNAISIGFGPTENLTQQISGKPLDELFLASAGRVKVNTYRGEKM